MDTSSCIDKDKVSVANHMNTQLPKPEFYRRLDQVVPGGDYEQLRNHPERQLYLTRISMDGLEEMHEYSKDERLYEYFEYEPFKTIRDTEKYLKKLIEQEGDKASGRTAICWFVRRLVDSKLTGTIRLVDIDYRRQSAEWGYAVAPQYWGQGYILEMQEVLKKYVFEELRLNRISGISMINNKPTISSVLAAGAKHEGTLRQYYKTKNGYQDGWLYSILAEDFFAAVGTKSTIATKGAISREMIANAVAEILGELNVGMDGDICSVAKWDSLNHINVILGIEQKVGYKFSPAEMSRATSIEEIYNILSKPGKG